MSQADLNITTADANTGTTFRAAVNTSLQALGSSQSGTSAPSTTYPNMLWADTANNLLKMRNMADSAWITIGTLDAANLGLAVNATVIATYLALAGGTMTGKIVLDGDATAELHPTSARQIQKGNLIYVADTGAADAYVGTLAPAITVYTSRMFFGLVIANANLTTTPTVILNGIATKTIKRIGSAPLLVGDLPVGHLALFWHDGTDMILLNPALHDHSGPNQGGTLGITGINTRLTFDGSATTPVELHDLNVSSLDDNATGNYTVNFTTSYIDADFVYTWGFKITSTPLIIGMKSVTTSSITLEGTTTGGTANDLAGVSLMISGTLV